MRIYQEVVTLVFVDQYWPLCLIAISTGYIGSSGRFPLPLPLPADFATLAGFARKLPHTRHFRNTFELYYFLLEKIPRKRRRITYIPFIPLPPPIVLPWTL